MKKISPKAPHAAAGQFGESASDKLKRLLALDPLAAETTKGKFVIRPYRSIAASPASETKRPITERLTLLLQKADLSSARFMIRTTPSVAGVLSKGAMRRPRFKVRPVKKRVIRECSSPPIMPFDMFEAWGISKDGGVDPLHMASGPAPGDVGVTETVTASDD